MAQQDIINHVIQMRSQQIPDDQIAQQMLMRGYSNADVFNALSQASVNAVYADAGKPQEETQSYPQYSQSSVPQMPMMDHSVDTSKISEIAESIIEEKWGDLVEHVNKIIEWKSSMELRLNTVDQQIKSMKSDFDGLQKAILGKINDSDSVMREVGTDIKALEQVFKKILPGFVENVNELSRITQTMKKK